MAAAVDYSDDREMSAEEIDGLLAQATTRLQAHAAALQKSSTLLNIPKLEAGDHQPGNSLVTDGAIVRVSAKSEDEAQSSPTIRKMEDPISSKIRAREVKKATAGSMWYNLPKTDLTPELKRDLQLIKMRGVLDPHRHYKKDNGKMQAPEFSMIGRIQEGATDFFSGRIEKRNRKQTIVEEVLCAEQDNGRFKRKYGEIQVKKASGKKGFYKALQAKRFKGVKKGG